MNQRFPPRYRAAHCDRCPTLSPALANGAAIVDGYVGQIQCTIGDDYCVPGIYVPVSITVSGHWIALVSVLSCAPMLGAHEKRPAKIAGRSMLRVTRCRLKRRSRFPQA